MNWGNKILAVFIVFATLIGTLVYKSYHVKTELVTPKYYTDEIAYQKVINASHNASKLSHSIEIEQSEKKIRLVLPSEINHEKLSGDLFFYCAYDSKNDLKCPLNIDAAGNLNYDSNKLKPGNYSLRINLIDDAKTYFVEKDILIHEE